jgi:hypothetical protein
VRMNEDGKEGCGAEMWWCRKEPMDGAAGCRLAGTTGTHWQALLALSCTL